MQQLDALKAWLFYVLPQHAISRIVYVLTRVESPRVGSVIRWFVEKYQVNLSDALQADINAYSSFNAFFTRALKDGARPIADTKQGMVSPVDGCVSALGQIADGEIFQAKGRSYSAQALLGGDAKIAADFIQGSFTTLYLSPRDYHRIHMPLSAKIIEQIYVPGRLFSVAPFTVNHINGVFARNERVIALCETDFGKIAMVLVGAMNVAAIETVWSGLVTPPAGKQLQHSYPENIELSVGEEMGRFNMGSTVILLTERQFQWGKNLSEGTTLQMGQKLGEFI